MNRQDLKRLVEQLEIFNKELIKTIVELKKVQTGNNEYSRYLKLYNNHNNSVKHYFVRSRK